MNLQAQLDLAISTLARISDMLLDARIAEANGDNDAADGLRVRAALLASDTVIAVEREKARAA